MQLRNFNSEILTYKNKGIELMSSRKENAANSYRNCRESLKRFQFGMKGGIDERYRKNLSCGNSHPRRSINRPK